MIFLSHFSEQILAALIHFGAAAGNSPYSFEAVPACGLDPKAPLCSLSPTCSAQGWRCAPPRWSESRNGWVVAESKRSAYLRYKGIAESIARVSFRLTRCKDENGIVQEICKRTNWPEGPESLAAVGAITAIFESGLREDIQFGYPPAGRGPDGEVCLLQVMPGQLSQYASWLTKEEKVDWERANSVRKRQIEEGWAAQMLGTDPEALDKCMDVGLRMLANARGACAGRGRSWAYGMWSMYGTGNTCNSSSGRDSPEGEDAVGRRHGGFAAAREGVYQKLVRWRPVIADDVRKSLGMAEPERPTEEAPPPKEII